jgi:hypothetical protein
MTLTIVNMIPKSLSRESEQDSEPNIAVNPANPQQIVATAFTPDPAHGDHAPIFVSNDGGQTWSLRTVVPGGDVTADISVAFGTEGGALYAGILNFSTFNLNILRTANPFGAAPMKRLVDRASEDQPWVTATTTAGHDHVFVSHNDFNSSPKTATIELAANARTKPAPAGFTRHVVEHRETLGQDGPPVRTAVHAGGAVYGAFHRWRTVVKETASAVDVRMDVCVVRDDDLGNGTKPFTDLKDPGDDEVGVRVARNRLVHFTASVGPLGFERIGGDLSIAVDPSDERKVWLAWCDRPGGVQSRAWTLHVRRSTNRGRTWSADVRTVKRAKNPALAVNEDGLVGLIFQQVQGTGATARWRTRLETTKDAFKTTEKAFTLHRASTREPKRDFLPYLGDYIRLVTVDKTFYGVFSGSNRPDMANFPNGVTYQRTANFMTHTLLRNDGVTPVPVSIDPFFVRYVPD